ncbi:MAG: cell wall-active antibiotics response protein [Spirochaetaceae bacterium]|jgi:hypothetical protein|nr:cell wall-active antibiotics response protein [Spirochaetaceae bacterium]
MPLPPEVLEERKSGLVETLSEQYARDFFSLEEYERLVEYAQKIETPRELALLGRILRENALGEMREAETGFQPGSTDRHYAILASRKIEGLPSGERNRDFVSILGDCQIFINEDDLVQEETLINAYALLGEVVIHVPENVTVINRAVPILGDVGVGKRKKRGADSPWNRKLVITGTAILGNVTVKYRK